MIKYKPYPSDKPDKKFYIITKDNKKVYFGSTGYEHYTEGHLDVKRRDAYIKRHQKNEQKFWNNPDKASYWSLKYLWSYPTKEQAYSNIKKDLKKFGYI